MKVHKEIWMKLVEELNELSTVLIQHHNKPNKDLSNKIIEEFGDVLFQIQRVKEILPEDVINEIDKRIAWKKAKYELKQRFNTQWEED
tara:strand:+ start:91 stop:354 length:264 start_codon:yes stop_codon:yes gene_type:complete